MTYTPEQQKLFFEVSKKFLSQEVLPIDITLLREVLIFHEWKYYVENQPLLSDYEYDVLYKKLEAIELHHPELISPDSPTQRVSSDLTASFDSVAHMIPMLSLDNSYDGNDLLDFDKQVRKLANIEPEQEVAYVVEPKFDGGSIALIYENDLLIRAATRGNGILGEEMTPNAKAISSIPLKAAFSQLGIYKVELRGEALIRKDSFAKINKAREEEGLALFANPRNAATGGLRTKDSSETRKRGIEAFIFQLGYAVDKDGNNMLDKVGNHNDSIDYLGTLGFKVPVKEKKLCKNIGEVIDFCAYWQEQRDTYAYEIDGMVVKVNEPQIQTLCGSTAHHPRWAIAYKFKAKQATTKLLAVDYQVGKIGSITPVAKVQPVHLAGVTVSSISLHNEDFIKSKDLRIGDTVLVERAGDVIPYIVKSLEELRTGEEQEVVFPEYCPINLLGTDVLLEKIDGEAAWRCPNCICGAQELQRIIFHVSKEAMDIDGFGKSYVERFYELGWLRDISDVYSLDYQAIAQLEGFGTRSAEKLRNAIDTAKHNSLGKILHSLSIHHLGKKASKLLAQQINHIMDLKDWDRERFLAIKDIGPVVADNVMTFFSMQKNVEMLRRMEEHGVDMSQKEEDKPLVVAADGALVDKSILFTGTLTQMGRKEAQDLATKLGARNISAVSSKLDILVVGDNAGSKLKKAQEIGTVQIMTEEEFIALAATLGENV